jgi:hypothetical protein
MAEDGTKSAADVLWSARLQEAERELAELAVNPDEQAKPAMRSTANPPPIGYVDQD